MRRRWSPLGGGLSLCSHGVSTGQQMQEQGALVPGGDDAAALAPKKKPRWIAARPEWFDAAKLESRLGSV